MNFSKSNHGKQFMCTHSHSTSARQNNLHVARQINGFGVIHHLFHVRAVDCAGKGKGIVPEAPCPQSIVSANDSCPSPKSDDANSVGSFNQFVINQANASIDDGAQQFGVVRLKLVRVTEKEVCGVWNQIIYRHFFHTQDDITSPKIFHHIDARVSVLLVCDAPHATRLHDQFYLRIGLLQIRALGRGEGNPLVRRHFPFGYDTNLHESNVAPPQPIEVQQL